MPSPWILLIVAGFFEAGWAIAMKYSEGFTRPGPSLLTIGLMAISVWLLATAMKNLPVGPTYAVWTGIGAVGAVILGMLLFDETVSFIQMICLTAIIAGIAGLHYTQI